MAHTSRRRSSRSVANDELIRRAIVDEIAAVGIDSLGPTGVARRAGLTTGAVYSRYESVPEMAVDAWVGTVGADHLALLDAVVGPVLAGDQPDALDGSVTALVAPTADTLAAVEIVAAARRVDELDEVVGEDMGQWMQRWGVVGNAGDAVTRATGAFTLAATWGVVLYQLAGVSVDDWAVSFRWAERAARTEPGPVGRSGSLGVPEPLVSTGDEVRDRLVTATMEVIGRVGLERTSVARIARRASLSQGVIYASHGSKEDLLADTVKVVLIDGLASAERDSLANRPDEDPLTRVAATLSGYLTAERSAWRHLRLEAHLSARHHPAVGDALRSAFDEALTTYPLAAGLDPATGEAVGPLLRYLAAVTLGMCLVDHYAGPLDALPWDQVVRSFGAA